ncbi:12897_t:CDS:1, partial [Funneliformis caledonium]
MSKIVRSGTGLMVCETVILQRSLETVNGMVSHMSRPIENYSGMRARFCDIIGQFDIN